MVEDHHQILLKWFPKFNLIDFFFFQIKIKFTFPRSDDVTCNCPFPS